MPAPAPTSELRWWRVRFQTIVARTSAQTPATRRWAFQRHVRPGRSTSLRLRSAQGREVDFKLNGGSFVRRVRPGENP